MGRPAKEPKEKLVEVPCKVTAEVEEELAQIAGETDRSRSQIARKMISRGLAAYYRDGRLDEPTGDVGADIAQAESIPTEKIPHALAEGQSLIPNRKKGGRK